MFSPKDNNNNTTRKKKKEFFSFNFQIFNFILNTIKITDACKYTVCAIVIFCIKILNFIGKILN